LLVVIECLPLCIKALGLLGVAPTDVARLSLKRTDPVPEPVNQSQILVELVLKTRAVSLGFRVKAVVTIDKTGEVIVGCLEGVAG
jgi:hypothetical protein